MARTRSAAQPADPVETTDDHVLDGDVVEEDVVVAGPAQVPARRGDPVASTAIVARDELSLADLLGQASLIETVMREAMRDGVHYGRIPGIDKPTLYKPGAEKLLVTFRLAPYYDSEKIWHDDGHLTVVTTCTLKHIPTDYVIATGEGMCTSRESKYAWRQGGRTCPACGSVGTIKKSKFPPREGDYPGWQKGDPPGWYCYGKVGGCGANFAAADGSIVEQQEVARIPNPDIADTWNTVLKMADKRALTAAVLNGTAASDVFTQDVEDGPARGRDDAALAPADDVSAPAVALTDSAPRGTLAEIVGVLRSIAPTMPWETWVEQAVHAQYAVDGGIRGIPADPPTLRQEAVIRLSNTVGRLADLLGGRDFPPPTRAECIQAFAFGFDGSLLAGPDVPLSPDEADLYPGDTESADADVDAPTDDAMAAAVDAAADAFTGPPGVA